ncbi:MAG: B12-binding domain-containing radical SAM protein [Sedimentisphaerales bacterium]|nr:B12-binding domain-containing radical SAM protein [Sedimentisphaerales bacterium]
MADRTLSARYKILFEGIFATMQTTQVPEPVMRRLVSPRLKTDRYGRARAATLGLRRLEAALIDHLGLEADQVVCTTPERLDSLLGPWTRIVAVSSSDPLGRGMSNTTTKNFWKGELYTKVWTERMMQQIGRAKQRFGFRVVAGGAGAWQWAADPESTRRHRIDTVFEGYSEAAGVRLFGDILEGTQPPAHLSEAGTAAGKICPIKGASLMGIIELSRGCGRGCRFCTVSTKPMVHLPTETILSDIETNLAAGITNVVSGSEDFFRYGSDGVRIQYEPLHALLSEMRRIRGLSFMQIDHANVSSVLQLTDEQLREIRTLLTWRKPSRFLWVNLGAESANGHLVAAASRAKIAPFRPEDWSEMVRQTVDRLNRCGFFPVLSIVLGLPGETPADVQSTLQLVRQLSRKHPLVVFPVFYEPYRREEVQEGMGFGMDRFRHDHLELYSTCYEINFRWVPKLFWDNQRAGGVSLAKRVLMRLLGKTEIHSWRKRFDRLAGEPLADPLAADADARTADNDQPLHPMASDAKGQDPSASRSRHSDPPLAACAARMTANQTQDET